MRILIYFGVVILHLIIVFLLVNNMKNRNTLLIITAGSFTLFTILKFIDWSFIRYSSFEFFVDFPLTLLILIMYIPVILGVYNRFDNYVNQKGTTISDNQVWLSIVISLLVFVGMIFVAIWQNTFLYWW